MKTAVHQVFYAVQGEKEADKLTEEIRPTANAAYLYAYAHSCQEHYDAMRGDFEYNFAAKPKVNVKAGSKVDRRSRDRLDHPINFHIWATRGAKRLFSSERLVIDLDPFVWFRAFPSDQR